MQWNPGECKQLRANIRRQISGSLSTDTCAVVFDLIENLPKDGVILDLNHSTGLSTVVLAKALIGWQKEDAYIIAIDPHISKPGADNPYVEGTLGSFLKNLRLFDVSHCVVPIVANITTITQIFNKKNADFVVVQIPDNSVGVRASLEKAVHIAQFSIRKGGIIVVLCPTDTVRIDFEKVTDEMFKESYKSLVMEDFVRAYRFE